MPVSSVAEAQAWREQRQNVAQRKAAPASALAAAPAPMPPRVGVLDAAAADGWRAVDGLGLDGDDLPYPGDDAPAGGGAAGSGAVETNEDRDRARTRREIAEANMAELLEAKQRREQIRVTAVQAQLATDYATTRDAMLQMSARMAPLLAVRSDPGEVQTLLEAEIHKALTTLAGAADHVPLIEGGFE
jgi:hypothetical protein